MSHGFFVEALNVRHDRRAFDCGEASLNTYLQRYARQNTENGASCTYVAVQPESVQNCAYFTLSAGAVALTDFPEDVRKGWPGLVPSAHLGRFAVDKNFQGQQLGRAMLDTAISTALEAADLLGIAVLELWALNDTARRFYEKFEFVNLLDDPNHLYLPLETARRIPD